MIGTIIKPSVGLSPEATAELVEALVAKAASISSRTTNCRRTGRIARSTRALAAVMRVINDHAERTGKKVMYAANLTGEIDEMLRAPRSSCSARAAPASW